ncbi:hypothetical protein [Cupriavidus sp. YAF13]|uniref:hypothetical protein n=1 Tax=Cupriavidus sp. YAF13 TaxID=3233075 RepID=UPI003F906EE4
MHLKLSFTPPRPNGWIVIDDFGVEHDALFRDGDFGGSSDAPCRARWAFEDTGDEDPDYFRISSTHPRPYYCREAVPFTSAFGLSIEIDLTVDFQLIPAWDEDAGLSCESRESGARIEILHTSGWDQPYMVSLDKKALEDFCWAYIDLEKAREDAERKARLAKPSAEALQ